MFKYEGQNSFPFLETNSAGKSACLRPISLLDYRDELLRPRLLLASSLSYHHREINLLMIHDRSLVSQAKGTCTMTFSDLFLKELNELDDPMCELQGDSNLELPLNETVRAQLKQFLASLGPGHWGYIS